MLMINGIHWDTENLEIWWRGNYKHVAQTMPLFTTHDWEWSTYSTDGKITKGSSVGLVGLRNSPTKIFKCIPSNRGPRKIVVYPVYIFVCAYFVISDNLISDNSPAFCLCIFGCEGRWRKEEKACVFARHVSMHFFNGCFAKGTLRILWCTTKIWPQ